MDIEGFILAGGRSSRMGSDKALLQIGGKLIIKSIADSIRKGLCTRRISLVTAFGSQKPSLTTIYPELPQISDIHENLGPVGGLHASLASSRSEWIAVVSCDLPFVTGALFERLSQFAQPGIDTVIPVQTDGFPQPLCGLYRVRPWKIVLETISGRHRDAYAIKDLLAQADTRYVAFDQLVDLPDSEHLFVNVNTVADLEKAKVIASDNQ